jgi:hypothetical protein
MGNAQSHTPVADYGSNDIHIQKIEQFLRIGDTVEYINEKLVDPVEHTIQTPIVTNYLGIQLRGEGASRAMIEEVIFEGVCNTLAASYPPYIRLFDTGIFAVQINTATHVWDSVLTEIALPFIIAKLQRARFPKNLRADLMVAAYKHSEEWAAVKLER